VIDDSAAEVDDDAAGFAHIFAVGSFGGVVSDGGLDGAEGEGISAADAEGVCFDALVGESEGEFVDTDDGGVVSFGKFYCVAEVVAVGVCDDDEIGFEVGCFVCSDGVAGDEGVDGDGISSVGDYERCVSYES